MPSGHHAHVPISVLSKDHDVSQEGFEVNELGRGIDPSVASSGWILLNQSIDEFWIVNHFFQLIMKWGGHRK